MTNIARGTTDPEIVIKMLLKTLIVELPQEKEFVTRLN